MDETDQVDDMNVHAGAKKAELHPADGMTVKVWRGERTGEFQSFDVPRRENQTVLDVVTEIQRTQDPTLSYRFACRVGMCGSCAMIVNGRPRWTCRTRVDQLEAGPIELEPLRNLPIVKDLAVDMAPFFDKWRSAHGYFEPGESPPEDFAIVAPESTERQAADAGIECINCGVCYSACDTVRWNADYLGPAALNRAWTLLNDQRDSGNPARLQAVAADGGCHACHSHQSCQEHCPQALNPTASIAGLKRRTMLAYLKGEL